MTRWGDHLNSEKILWFLKHNTSLSHDGRNVTFHASFLAGPWQQNCTSGGVGEGRNQLKFSSVCFCFPSPRSQGHAETVNAASWGKSQYTSISHSVRAIKTQSMDVHETWENNMGLIFQTFPGHWKRGGIHCFCGQPSGRWCLLMEMEIETLIENYRET